MTLWCASSALSTTPTALAQETPEDPLLDEAPVAEGFEDDFDDFGEYDVPAVYDPFEGFNRSVLKFNNTVIKYGLRPVANGYEAVVPEVARRGLTSFFENLRFPVRFVGCLLQGKVERAGTEVTKFLINTTIGVGGFFDVAGQEEALRVPSEDIGQVFGKWGIGAGPYLVLPILGPSSARDLPGSVGDSLLSPTNRRLVQADWRFGVSYLTTNTLRELPERLRRLDELNAMALDPYIALRNGYTQYRQAEIAK